MREGWSKITLGEVFELSNRKLGKHKNEPEIFAISKYDGVVRAQEYFEKRIASKSLDGYKVIGPGDWVYSTIHIDEGSIAVNHFPFEGVVSPMYTSMKWGSNQHSATFFEYLLKSDEALIQYQENAQGTVNRRRSLSWKAFSSLVFLVPPLVEQKRIVDLVSSVDSYIDSLQQQVDAARAARNAVLHELLSAGGEKWSETTLGDVAEYVNGYAFKPSDLGDEGVPVIRIKQLLDANEKVDRSTIQVPERCVLADGDIVFSWSGTLAVRVWNRGHAFLNQHLFKVIEKPGVLHQWLPLVIDHAIDELVEKSHGTTMKHITKQTLLPHEVLLPPLVEQKRIVDIVSSMDDVVQSAEQALNEAKNLRSGLLSDLLSGNHAIPESYDEIMGAA